MAKMTERRNRVINDLDSLRNAADSVIEAVQEEMNEEDYMGLSIVANATRLLIYITKEGGGRVDMTEKEYRRLKGMFDAFMETDGYRYYDIEK